MKVLVTGAKGQLGQSMQKIAMQVLPSASFLWTDVDELDITSLTAVEGFIANHKPDYIINCAAYTAVDKAESEPDKALLINAEAPRLLASASHRHGARLIHVSTDYVFNGRSNTPYSENHPPDPQGMYGFTKLQGELLVAENAPQSLIIRTSWLYSEYGHNFVKTMLKLGSERHEIGVVSDQYGSPTYAGDLARAILEFIRQGADVPGGIYHYCNQGITTWHGLATRVMEMAGLHCRVNAITTAEYPTAAYRPGYSVLQTNRLQETLGITIPEWESSLQTCMNNITDLS
ncbi:MAG: dTDP-4-dehydrorhamnose reductase [Bacteroidales bacterium]|nr:dTDP-4-dehydrorhamnose reductase [Bacteroidales bacterium]